MDDGAEKEVEFQCLKPWVITETRDEIIIAAKQQKSALCHGSSSILGEFVGTTTPVSKP
jgi:hypothetical protein